MLANVTSTLSLKLEWLATWESRNTSLLGIFGKKSNKEDYLQYFKATGNDLTIVWIIDYKSKCPILVIHFDRFIGAT